MTKVHFVQHGHHHHKKPVIEKRAAAALLRADMATGQFTVYGKWEMPGPYDHHGNFHLRRISDGTLSKPDYLYPEALNLLIHAGHVEQAPYVFRIHGRFRTFVLTAAGMAAAAHG